MRKSCSKVIIENFFEPCLLFLLLKKPGYGYEIKAQLDEQCGCQANIGNLYRCLARLTQEGRIAKKSVPGIKGPERIMYSITADGKKLLAEWMGELETESAKLNKLITNYKSYGKRHSKKS